MNIFKDLEKYKDRIAIITDSSEKITYDELLQRADKIASAVKRDLVFIVCKNSLDSLAGYIGFLRAGAVMALIDSNVDLMFMKNLLKTYKPKFIYLPTASKFKELYGDAETVSIFGDYTLVKSDYTIDYSLHKNLCLLVTTSGSTGTVKFVRQSYKNIRSNTESIVEYLGITKNERAITSLPLSYTYGQSIIHSHLFEGACIVLTDSSVVQKHFWELVKEHKVTSFSGVPFTFEMLKKLHFDDMDLSCIRYITQAGGKLHAKLAAEFIKSCAKKHIGFYIMYGQAEATTRMSYLPPEIAEKNSKSIGIAIPRGEIWLEDDGGEIINESGKPGELIYKGENVTLGYAENCYDLAKGDENKGILHTGDIAQRDEQGLYYIVGRKKRFIKMFGKRTNLDEVEQMLKHEGFDCACGGSDDGLKIYITDKQFESGIRKYVTTILKIANGRFDIIHIYSIPRNQSGKVLYSKLEDM